MASDLENTKVCEKRMPLDRRLCRLNYDDVVDWMGERFAARAWNYREKVCDIYATEDGYVGYVRGTDRYTTKLMLDPWDEFGSICSCPIGEKCKHAGALAFVVSERLKQGVEISRGVPSLMLETLEKAKSRKLQTQKKEPHQAKTVSEYTLKFKQLFAASKQAVDDACRTSDVELIKDRLVDFLSFAEDDEFYMSPAELESESACIAPTVDRAIERRREIGESLVELLVWGYEIQTKYSLYGTWLREMIDHPRAELSDSMTWRQVAEKLERSLLELPSDADCSLEMENMMHFVREAWRRAGNEERALEPWLKMNVRCGYWYETAEFLNKFGRFDEAIAVAREGVHVGDTTSEYGNDYSNRLQTPLAEAFGGKGDWIKATSILAEQFLDCVGAYDFNRNEASFEKVLEFADRAGCREEVRRALIHVLETGWNPKCLWAYPLDSLPRLSDWRSVPIRVKERSTDPLRRDPDWPLPKANEGIRLLPFRWHMLRWFCQLDMEFLLRLAISKGDKEEAARRFEDLIEFPRKDSKVDVEKLREMMRGYRQDIVEAICMKTRLRYLNGDYSKRLQML